MAVTVSLDTAAVAAIGGRAALAAQLHAADLVAAGWVVTGPQAGAGVADRHHRQPRLRQPGPSQPARWPSWPAPERPAAAPSSCPFSDRRSFWRTDTVLTGKVDLTCGLNCFGDSGLKSALGFRPASTPGR